MSTTQCPSLLAIDRPTLGRHALIVGVLSAVCVMWIGTTDQNTRAGDLIVPAYYFPIEADVTEKYVAAREIDCGGAISSAPLDYPAGWLKP